MSQHDPGCDAVQQWLVDEGGPRPEGLEAHLAGCAACQEVRAAHAAALRLRGAAPALAQRVPLARVRQRAAALGAAGLLLVGGAGWWRLQGVPAVTGALAGAASPAAAPEGHLAGPPPAGDAAAFQALAELGREVSRAGRRNPAVHDAAYRAFGPLSTWVALETPPPARALGRAASPLVSAPED